jgi:mannitol 2-dehydrogenase
MKSLIKLNAKSLADLPAEVVKPSYNRKELRAGIVHIGLGAFHRSHQAYYTDRFLKKTGSKEWGICGVALLETDRRIFETLRNQDGLYALMITAPDGTLNVRIIGSIIEYLFAPADPMAVINKMADPRIKIISLTITEGGYNINSATGEFQISEPSVQWDLNNPDKPRTIFGYLTHALKKRRDKGIPGLTIQSCDNIQKNGQVLKKMLLSYIRDAEPGLAGWIEKEVSFPDSMVDRITPATTPNDIEKLKSVYGIDDAWPVVCEPFIQWVVEDNYVTGRPEWESVGVQFVTNVAPYEKMKIRLLNAGHSLLGFTGALHGCRTIDETVNIPLFCEFLREFMDIEVTPVLGHIEGIDLEKYKDSLIERFGNDNIKDNVSRICMESSAKIPKFLIPTITEQLHQGGQIKRSALIVASWCRYLELAGTTGHDYEIEDKMSSELQAAALASMQSDPLAFLKIEAVFGDLAQSKRFTDIYLLIIESIRKNGIEQTIRRLNYFTD